MGSKKNILTTIAIFMFVVFVAMIINITINLRDFSINSAKTKAQLVAQSVRNGLTAHMVNGMMDQREFFINETKNLKNIDDLWIVRAQSVIDQYGKGEDLVRDELDKKALQTGKMQESVNENIFGHSTYRVTIPYNAEITKTINCMQCHNVKEGETLGIITMVSTIDDMKSSSLKIIAIVAIVSLILSIIIILYINKLVYPYLSIFSAIKNVMQKANKGDYSGRIINTSSAESKEVAHWINEHMQKLQNSLLSIEETIDIFLTNHKSSRVKDPIIDVENTVKRLADIYNFRKTIEHDEYIKDVYERLSTVLKEKFNLDNFNFIEADTTNKKTQIVYVSKEILCDPITDGCRADRTNTLIDSCQFSSVCDKFKNKDKFYLCVPYSISNDLDFIISIVSESKDENERVRTLIPLIQDYIDTAKPEIVSKKLMQILERNAQTDPLTGLYNRKFLEHYIEKNLYNGMNRDVSCGVMMVDIDFFKLINDNYGHDIGDIAIKTIANTLIDVTNEDNVIIRFGGEEFIVIMIDYTEDEIMQKAEDIRIAFSQQQINAGDETFTKTVSIGVSTFINKNKDFWKYVKQSDIALYEAKQTGRNKVVKYTKDLK
jgi:diguanylate cyclase (GGDEF)-like protein